MAYTNSSLVTYKKLSPNHSGTRTHEIDTITIHCIVGQWTAKQGCDYFASTDRSASCNYIVGKDGSIGLCVEEKNRSWCSSNAANDQRAVTIETASDTTDPYAVTDAAYNALIKLCADICKRNGIKKLVWSTNKDDRINHRNGCNMTVHRDFASKACPGEYLYSRHGDIAKKVNAILDAEDSANNSNLYRVRLSWDDPKSQIGAYADLENAKAACKDGYTVYDSNGKAVYGKEFTDSSKLYRVRKSWEDEKSQIGAYGNLDNAKAACKEGYTVYDWNGKAVYSVPVETETKEQLYRVRKTWVDSKSQIGAYKDLNNAKNACPEGYSVFDESGKAVYTKPVSTPEEPKQEQEKESITPTIISPLKGLSNEEFIEYVGVRAKADMDKTGVLASVTIAQAILESSWGQSELSLYANNLFGMKTSLSGNTWDSEWTGEKYSKETKEEYEPGVITTITADFRAYKTVEASIKDHSDYLLGAKKGSELRYKGLKDEMDYKKAIQIIKDGGYATDSSYVDKICGIIEKYNLDEYDKKEEVIIPDVTVKPDDNEFEEVHGKLDTILKALETILTIVTNIAEAIKRIFK